MTYGDLYDQIPLAWGLIPAIFALGALLGAIIWRRIHPRD